MIGVNPVALTLSVAISVYLNGVFGSRGIDIFTVLVSAGFANSLVTFALVVTTFFDADSMVTYGD